MQRHLAERATSSYMHSAQGLIEQQLRRREAAGHTMHGQRCACGGRHASAAWASLGRMPVAAVGHSPLLLTSQAWQGLLLHCEHAGGMRHAPATWAVRAGLELWSSGHDPQGASVEPASARSGEAGRREADGPEVQPLQRGQVGPRGRQRADEAQAAQAQLRHAAAAAVHVRPPREGVVVTCRPGPR
jgi:hypothetical protein